jgi:hypothetical protein
MVWGAIWLEGRSRLVIITRDKLAKHKGFSSRSYMQALQEGLLPVYDGTRHFQQDNASIHRSIVTEAFLAQNAILSRPMHDLTPTKAVWHGRTV